MNFCSGCGNKVHQAVPPGDNRVRWCCAHCGAIHYQNPNVVVGTVSTWAEEILLCRRAIEPRYGLWTLPAGFLENDETTAQGAERETREEAGATIELLRPYAMIDVPHVNQVHLFYRARMLHPELDPGEESLEARLFQVAEIPWDRIAFRTVEKTLRWFIDDLAAAQPDHLAPIHYDAITLGLRPRGTP